MAASVDGRIATEGWPDTGALRREYEIVHERYEADGWICGRVTMEALAKGMRSEEEIRCEYTGGGAREDFRAPGDYDSFAFAIAKAPQSASAIAHTECYSERTDSYMPYKWAPSVPDH
jgi:2,5-diamino-6-(ribosylamino)-4(3H)-pyrimidinone 5'-phosphate reductase